MKCLLSDAPVAAIRRDSVDAARVGLRGTPLVLVNQLLLAAGAPTLPALDSLISAADTGRKKGR
jgi:predicted DsbA family dithiol-disulfide isomerase